MIQIQTRPQVFDAIVVGSGATGGWAAKQLTEAGMSVAVLEAAAAAVPVIGTTVGYVADWSPTRAAAIDATPESLAEGILAMHAHPNRPRAIAAEARTFSVDNDAAWVSGQFEQLWRALKERRTKNEEQRTKNEE